MRYFASISQRLLRMIVHHEFYHCRNAMRELLSCVEYLLYWEYIESTSNIYFTFMYLNQKVCSNFYPHNFFVYGMELELELHVPNCYTLIFIWNFQFQSIKFSFYSFSTNLKCDTANGSYFECRIFEHWLYYVQKYFIWNKKKHSTP